MSLMSCKNWPSASEQWVVIEITTGDPSDPMLVGLGGTYPMVARADTGFPSAVLAYMLGYSGIGTTFKVKVLQLGPEFKPHGLMTEQEVAEITKLQLHVISTLDQLNRYLESAAEFECDLAGVVFDPIPEFELL
jgi:hypothetical protein